MAILRKQIKGPRPPSEYDPNRAAADARNIARTFTLIEQPLRVFDLAAVMGLTVIRQPLPNSISGYLKVYKEGWEIGINSLHHPNRQRFTMAHELGHYFLHRDRGEFEDGLLFRKDNQSNPAERQANEFAALLLMPLVEFKRALRNNDISIVATYFGVSQQAAEYRRESITDQIDID